MGRQTFGERLKARREYLNFNQQDVATLLGVGRVTISNWERGERGIDVDDIPRLARALKVHVSYFFDDAPDNTEDGQDLTGDEAEVLRYYRGVPPLLKPQAKRTLKSFMEEDPDYDEGQTFGRKVE